MVIMYFGIMDFCQFTDEAGVDIRNNGGHVKNVPTLPSPNQF